MTRSPYLVSLIVASALSTGLLLPFACGGIRGPTFGSAGSDDDDREVVPSLDEAAPCSGDECLDARAADCATLVARTCGGCTVSAACKAATLLSTYEPEGCAGALLDEQTFPTCTARPCVGLMERVCGGTTPTEACASTPGCAPARVLYERSTSPSSTTAEIEQADASCAAALTDDAVFAPCGG